MGYLVGDSRPGWMRCWEKLSGRPRRPTAPKEVSGSILGHFGAVTSDDPPSLPSRRQRRAPVVLGRPRQIEGRSRGPSRGSGSPAGWPSCRSLLTVPGQLQRTMELTEGNAHRPAPTASTSPVVPAHTPAFPSLTAPLSFLAGDGSLALFQRQESSDKATEREYLEGRRPDSGRDGSNGGFVQRQGNPPGNRCRSAGSGSAGCRRPGGQGVQRAAPPG